MTPIRTHTDQFSLTNRLIFDECWTYLRRYFDLSSMKFRPIFDECSTELSRWLIESMTQWVIDSLSHWLNEPMTQWVIDSISHWRIESITHWGIETLSHWLIESLTHWPSEDRSNNHRRYFESSSKMGRNIANDGLINRWILVEIPSMMASKSVEEGLTFHRNWVEFISNVGRIVINIPSRRGRHVVEKWSRRGRRQRP